MGNRGRAAEQVASINGAAVAREKQREVIKPPRKQRQVDRARLGILWNTAGEDSPTTPAQQRFMERKGSKALRALGVSIRDSTDFPFKALKHRKNRKNTEKEVAIK